MRSLDGFAGDKLAALERAQLRRVPAVTTRAGIWAERDGRRLLSFSCNDYLNFSQHPRIIAAAIDAIKHYGVGAGASRLVTGNHPLYDELETRLARLKGSEAACVFGSGYLANTGIIPALVGSDDLILVDELAHACIHASAKLSGAQIHLYRHCDPGHAETILAQHRGGKKHVLIATDGVFSMDGDIAPLAALSTLARRFDAWLLSDDAHGLGVVGGGRGSAFINGAASASVDVPLQAGTLSKAVGAYGGYLCASRAVIDLMRTRARTFIYSTGLPPAIVAAAIAALDIIESGLCRRALAQSAAVYPCAQSAGRAKRDRPGDRRRCRRRARSIRSSARQRLSGRRDPSADSAGRHGAAALCFYRPAPRRRHRAACRNRASAGFKALIR
jgi:8-amino-7-oxononanoate synthase